MAFFSAIIRGLCEERWASRFEQQSFDVDRLDRILRRAVAHGSRAHIDDGAYARALGLDRARQLDARALCSELCERLSGEGLLDAQWSAPLEVIRSKGTLAERLVWELGQEPDRAALTASYRKLGECLLDNRPFLGSSPSGA
jgi:hypothetical protein